MGQTGSVAEERLEDRYHLQKVKLGKGSFGSVWRGVDRRDQSVVAVKQLDKKGASRREIEREVAMMRACTHVNLLKLYQTYEDDKTVSLVVEYCADGDFGDKVKERATDLREFEAAEWMRQICSAIAALHAKGICHRDIKPDNFLVSMIDSSVNLTNGYPGAQQRSGDKAIVLKLADFGLSVYVPPGQLLTQKCGTPACMAPELFRLPDRSPGYSLAVDVWAAGVTMCMLMCAGEHPFITRSGELDANALEHGTLDFTGRKSKTMGDRLFGSSSEDNASTRFSEVARAICQHMVELDPQRRLTAAAALQNGWFHQGSPPQNIGPPFVPRAAGELAVATQQQQQQQARTTPVPMPIGPAPNETAAHDSRHMDAVRSSEQARNAELATLRQEAIALRERNKEFDQLVAQLHFQSDARARAIDAEERLNVEVTTLRRESITLRERNKELDALVAQLQLKSDGSTRAVDADQRLNGEVAALRHEAITLRERNKELDALVAQVQSRADGTARAIDAEQRLNVEVTTLRREAIALRETNKELEGLVAQLQSKAEVAARDASREQWGGQVASAKIDSRIDELQDEIAKRDSRIAALSDGTNHRDVEISRLANEISERDARMAQLAIKVDEQDAELRKLRGDMAKRDAENTRLSHEITRCRDDIALSSPSPLTDAGSPNELSPALTSNASANTKCCALM